MILSLTDALHWQRYMVALACGASLAIGASCAVDVNHGARQYSCAEEGLCPSGYSCELGMCVLPDTVADDSGPKTDADPLAVADANIPPDASPGLDLQIAASDEDAEELVATGVVNIVSTDLEIVENATDVQIVALRFPSLDIGNGEPILSAEIQFAVDEVSVGDSSLSICTEASAVPDPLVAVVGNLSGRPCSNETVNWTALPWSEVGASGGDQATPDLKAIMQERVDAPEWRRGNPMVFIFTGSGRRTAVAFDGIPMSAPRLRIRFE